MARARGQRRVGGPLRPVGRLAGVETGLRQPAGRMALRPRRLSRYLLLGQSSVPSPGGNLVTRGAEIVAAEDRRAAQAAAGQSELDLEDAGSRPDRSDRYAVRTVDPGPTRPIRVTTTRYTFELVRDGKRRYPRGCSIGSTEDAIVIARNVIGAQPVEVLVVIFLDARGTVLGFSEVARGSLNGVRLRARDVILPALLVNAASIIVMHNHPSGNPAPSPSDRDFTAQLRAATDLVGVPMFDHVIVTERRGYSFRATRRWRDSTPEAPDDSVLHGLASFTGGAGRRA